MAVACIPNVVLSVPLRYIVEVHNVVAYGGFLCCRTRFLILLSTCVYLFYHVDCS